MAKSLIDYEPSDRFLYKLNPITRMVILIVVIISGMVFSGPSYPYTLNLAIFLFLIVVSISGGIPLGKEFRLRGAYVLGIALILFIGNLIFARGGEDLELIRLRYGIEPKVYFSIPRFVYITNISLNYAISKTILILNSVLAVIILLKSTRLSDLTYSLQKIGVPYSIAMLISTSFRCIPMVTDGLLIVYDAERARGFEMEKGGILERIKQWKALLIPLMFVLLKWVDLMSIVFQSRGLDFSNRRRTHLREQHFSLADWVFTVFVVISSVFLVLILTGTIRFKVG
jgi:energy-coupling factor transport system permease protein